MHAVDLRGDDSPEWSSRSQAHHRSSSSDSTYGNACSVPSIEARVPSKIALDPLPDSCAGGRFSFSKVSTSAEGETEGMSDPPESSLTPDAIRGGADPGRWRMQNTERGMNVPSRRKGNRHDSCGRGEGVGSRFSCRREWSCVWVDVCADMKNDSRPPSCSIGPVRPARRRPCRRRPRTGRSRGGTRASCVRTRSRTPP